MSPEKFTLTRQELYEKVWSTPMQKLAKEFSLSDVGLAKLCRRHDIPLPGRGYWARIQAGQKPGRTPLPALNELRLNTVRIYPSEPRGRDAMAIDEGEVIPTIEVPEDQTINHLIARRIERSMSRKTIDERGMLATRQGRTVPLRLTAGALPRALRILDALFAALDDAKYVLEWAKPYNTPLNIVTNGEKLHLTVMEAIERKKHIPQSEELARQKVDYWWRVPRWDYTPTGRLKLTLESCEYPGMSQSWADGKRRKIESCLGEAHVMCPKMAAAVKKERIDRAEAECHRREEEKRRIEEAARKAEYDRKAKAVKALAYAWQESRLLREFAKALHATAAAADLPEETRCDLQIMIEWSLSNAEYTDPLTNLKWTLVQFKNPPWY